MAAPRRSALVVATSRYEERGLRQLRAPTHDARELARVLEDPAIGGFTTATLLDQPAAKLQEEIEGFFQDAGRGDLLLLHFSCHGIKRRGELYFAATNTRLDRLVATSVPAAFVQRQMTESRSDQIVLLLDCCYGGAWDRGTRPRAAGGADIEDRFEGRGRVVITAASALEFAFEGDDLTDAGSREPSVFTGAIVRGLDTGEADLDQDGEIEVDELYEYVYEQVRSRRAYQTPEKSAYNLSGRLRIARRRTPVRRPADLPAELQGLVQSLEAARRLAAVAWLIELQTGRHQGLALAARLALTALAQDDSRRVAAAATAALARTGDQTTAATSPPGPTRPGTNGQPASGAPDQPGEQSRPQPAGQPEPAAVGAESPPDRPTSRERTVAGTDQPAGRPDRPEPRASPVDPAAPPGRSAGPASTRAKRVASIVVPVLVVAILVAISLINLLPEHRAAGGQGNSAIAGGPVTLGFMGAQTGAYAQLGINVSNGARLAIDQHNARSGVARVTLKIYDTQGDQTQGNSQAARATQDRVAGVIGPAFSGESSSAVPVLEEAGIPNISPSATAVSLAGNGWKTWHRVLADDGALGPALADFMATKLGVKKAAVLNDRSVYGKGLAEAVRKQLASDGVTVAVNDSIDPIGSDYSSTVSKVQLAGVDAVFFGGYYPAAGKLVRQLREGGVSTAKFLSGDGSLDPGFVRSGGPAAEGALLSCSCSPAAGSTDPAMQKFAADYKARYGTDPGLYAAEGFDAATAFLRAIDAGKRSAADVLAAINASDFTGVSRQIKFGPSGNPANATVFITKVVGGKLTPLGNSRTAQP
ncbi:MAG TPA: ABC transporter substrate-binding protein [Mycobacteriales bacterium]|nr:ABC transporter substrate-binding protein [Mycobacteriales bacterium]